MAKVVFSFGDKSANKLKYKKNILFNDKLKGIIFTKV